MTIWGLFITQIMSQAANTACQTAKAKNCLEKAMCYGPLLFLEAQGVFKGK